MSRSERFLSGLSLGLAHQVLTLAVGLVVTPWLLARLGAADMGLWMVATSLLGYLGLLDLGVAALLPREVAYATGRNPQAPQAAAGEVLGQALSMALVQLPLVAAGAGLLLLLLPERGERLLAPFLVVLLTYVLLFPLRLLPAALQGLQDLRFLGVLQVVGWAAGTATSVGLVLAGAGLFAVAAGWGVGQLLSVLGCLWRLWRTFPQARPRGLPRASLEQVRAWLGRSVWLTVTNVAQLLRLGTDVVVIGKLMGPEAVVAYGCTAKLVSVLSQVPQQVLASAQPALAELRAGSSRERVAEVSSALERLTLLASGAVACGVLALNEGFVARWVGPEQYAGLGLTLLLLLSMLLRHWCLSVNACLFCFGYERRLALTALVDGAVTVAALCAGVALWGWMGAALAPIVGICSVSLPLNVSLLARDTGRSPGQVLRPLLAWAWRAALACAAALGLALGLVPHSWPLLFATGVLAGGLYALLTAPLLFQPPLAPYVRPRLEVLGARLATLTAGWRAR